MNEVHLKQAPMYAMKNKLRIESSTRCGCYYCLEIFPKEEIAEWTDGHETALCPHCHVDSLIPDATGFDLNTQNLKTIHDFWFATTKS